MNFTQQGYGVPSRDRNHPEQLPPGAATDQGVWKTDLATGKTSLLVSLADVAAHIPGTRTTGRWNVSISGIPSSTVRARGSCRYCAVCSRKAAAMPDATPWCSPMTRTAVISITCRAGRSGGIRATTLTGTRTAIISSATSIRTARNRGTFLQD